MFQLNKIVKFLLGLGILTFGGFILLQMPNVQDRLLENAIPNLVQDNMPKEDALSAIVCGSRSPLPDSSRDEACILVIAGKNIYVIDTGAGSANNVNQWGIPANRIKAVLLTHLHSDHIADLPNFHMITWINNRPSQLDVYGPEGLESVVQGFEDAYSLDYAFRNTHHGDTIAPLAVAGMKAHTIDLNNPVIIESDDLSIQAFAVEHHPVKPALGYRFDYKGRSIVISGDTSASQNLTDHSRNADVLFHEAQANHILKPLREFMLKNNRTNQAKILDDITTYHTTPVEAAAIAKEANVKHLVFYHLTPAPRNDIMAKIFTRGVSDVFEEWTLSDDGTMVVLPVGSEEIQISNLN